MSFTLHESRFTMLKWGFRNIFYSGQGLNSILIFDMMHFRQSFGIKKQVPRWLWAELGPGFRFWIMEIMIKGISLPPFDNHNLCSCSETTQGINKLFHWMHPEIWLETEATMLKLKSFEKYLNLIRWSVQWGPLPNTDVNDDIKIQEILHNLCFKAHSFFIIRKSFNDHLLILIVFFI